MKTIITLLFIMVFPFSGFASGKFLSDKHIQVTIQEANFHLKEVLTRELSRGVGINEFNLKVKAEVDEKKLKETLGVSEEDWSKLQGLQLPGLFVEGKEALSLSPLRMARKEDILLSLKRVEIQVFYHESNYNQEFIQESLKKIAGYNFPQFKPDQIKVTATKESAPYRKSETSNQFMEALSKPLKIDMNESAFQQFWNEHYKVIVGAATGLMIVLALGITLILRGGMGTLSEVIKAKNLSVTAPHLSNGPQSTSQTNALPVVQTSNGQDKFESYVQASKYLDKMIHTEPKVFNEVVLLKVMVEDFVSLTLLMDVLPKDKKESFLKNIQPEKKERFKEFIVSEGTRILEDEVSLKEEAIKLIKLIKVASLSPSDLYHIVTTDLLYSMTTSELTTLVSASTDREKNLVCEMVDEHKLANLLQNDILNAENLQGVAEDLSKSELLDFLIKATTFKVQKKVRIRKEKLESIYAQVETEKAEVLADAMGLEPELRFENLFSSFSDEALNYLSEMDYSNLSQLYPLLTSSMQKDIIGRLPELLAERLRFSKKTVNPQSLKLKGEFYFYLRSLVKAEGNSSINHLKLAA